PWGDRLFCYHASLDEFAEEIEDKYDLITCNPPFYKPSETEESVSIERKMARFYDALPFTDLLEYTSQLLAEKGHFNVIIPFSEEEDFLHLASNYNLYPNQITHVHGNKSSPVKRSLINLSFDKTEVKKEKLILEKKRHEYTDEYLKMVKPFYLKL
ncbi:MAG: tRNA (adenine-N(6)-)-methyltransferase, partial [Gillisia sp.]